MNHYPILGVLGLLLVAASLQAQPAPSDRVAPAIKSASTTSTVARDKATTQAIENAICPVSKQEIGSMGPGKKVQHKGYEFSLCCAGCTEEFNKNPDTYLEAALKSSKAKPKVETQPGKSNP